MFTKNQLFYYKNSHLPHAILISPCEFSQTQNLTTYAIINLLDTGGDLSSNLHRPFREDKQGAKAGVLFFNWKIETRVPKLERGFFYFSKKGGLKMAEERNFKNGEFFEPNECFNEFKARFEKMRDEELVEAVPS